MHCYSPILLTLAMIAPALGQDAGGGFLDDPAALFDPRIIEQKAWELARERKAEGAKLKRQQAKQNAARGLASAGAAQSGRQTAKPPATQAAPRRSYNKPRPPPR